MNYLLLTIIFQEEDDGRWTAECKELDTASFGNTIEGSRQNIEEAICLHLNTLKDVGELDRFLKENNIKISKTKPKIKILL